MGSPGRIGRAIGERPYTTLCALGAGIAGELEVIYIYALYTLTHADPHAILQRTAKGAGA